MPKICGMQKVPKPPAATSWASVTASSTVWGWWKIPMSMVCS